MNLSRSLVVFFMLASTLTIAFPQSPREVLSTEALNARAWALAPLETPVPSAIRDNLTLLREALLDEGKSAPEERRDSYKTGYDLCNLLIGSVDEHDHAAVAAGYRAAQAEANTRMTNQSLDAHAPYRSSWPQYARIKDQRTEVQRQENNKSALAREKVKLDWSNRVKVLQRGLDEAYMRYRHALREDSEFKAASLGPNAEVVPPATTQPGQPWINSLGMKFLPAPGTDVLCCIWETRVQDFAAFVDDTGFTTGKTMCCFVDGKWPFLTNGFNWRKHSFPQGPTHPVVGVSCDEALAFCEWLTRKEQTKLKRGQLYRLPTDLEWSRFVGLTSEAGNTPAERSLNRKRGQFYWGDQWPPPAGVGNFAGEEVLTSGWPVDDTVISGFNDSYPRTAPVGTFKANQFGLYDLEGNVYEWCRDHFDGSARTWVHRGGCWFNSDPSFNKRGGNGDSEFFNPANRRHSTPDFRAGGTGFRIVLTH